MTALERIRGRRIGIIGMARSGMAAARLIKKVGGLPFVSDIKTAGELSDRIHELKTFGIEFETGGHSDRLLQSDFVVCSPGIPSETTIVRRLVDSGIPVFSEIELASWLCRGQIIAVTGSNGKTTTTALIGAILDRAGIGHRVCGNIGYPFSDAVADIAEDEYAVVEVSSFQLEFIEEFSPHISLILNVTPDHLDRYADFDAYKEAKYRIAECQGRSDYLILNADDVCLSGDDIATKAQKIHFSTSHEMPAGVFKRGETLVGILGGESCEIIDVDRIRIPGPHNLQNSAAAALTALLLKIEPEVIAETLRQFAGVEHRLEAVATVAGVSFINDSKATNVDAVCYALKSFRAPICLIAGGRDKGGDFHPIIECGRGKIKEVVLIGEARAKMFETLGKSFPVQFAENLDDAVQKAFAAASPGDIVLLSPACASFDMFDNFEHRGREFKRAVSALKDNSHVQGGIAKD
jgi:UDP-N-acetylmuramoylalanine--D-glutamate ligase